jgi:hypothetical protein
MVEIVNSLTDYDMIVSHKKSDFITCLFIDGDVGLKTDIVILDSNGCLLGDGGKNDWSGIVESWFMHGF